MENSRTAAGAGDAGERMLRRAIEAYVAGRYDTALAILDGLMVLDPRDPRPVRLVGSIKMLQGRHVDAVEWFQRARALGPGDPYVLVALGELWLDAFEFDAAVKVLRELFASAAPDHPAFVRGQDLIARALKTLRAEK